MLVREAVRLSQAFVSFRQNVGPEMYIDGKVIPSGALVAYPGADVHLDPALYPDPWKFNPARPQPKGSLTYLGWGAGACLRLRLLPKGFNATIPPYISSLGAWVREDDLHGFANCATQYQAHYRVVAHEL